MINKPLYYFIVDNSTQWFSCIVETIGDKVCSMIDVPHDIQGDFLTNICDRELHFTNKLMRDGYYYGWSISRTEYETLKRIVELYPSYKSYLKLLRG